MPNRATLDPERRVLYGTSLQPPPGYVFDAAVATTYSLDFETALAIPVSLALFAAENRDDLLANPLALLEGAERIAGRLAIFTDAGLIHAQGRPQSRLCSFLESIIIEVAAPRGGAFHPKLWALRFKPIGQDEPIRLRLLVLSRNVTRDRSWDIALTLDGVVARRRHTRNRPVAELVRRLPDLAIVGGLDGATALTEELSRDLQHAEWVVPEEFDDVAFAVNGLGRRLWRPNTCARLGVISPFCDEETLSMLADLPTADAPVLIGRSDELAAMSPETLDRFRRVGVLDEMAATEDGEDPSREGLLGLHAKAYIAESGWETTVTVGSGNATRPALLSGRNVELFVTLTGRRARVGSVEDIMGSEGFGRLTRAFVPGEVGPIDPEVRTAEARIEEARRSLCRGGLKIHCAGRDAGEHGERLWQVWLMPPAPLPLSGIGAMMIWPITRGEGHARDGLEALRRGKPVDLGAVPLIDLTRFLAFRLVDASEKASALFSTGLPMEGLPDERDAAILRWLVDSKDAFFRYLRLLLAELGDPFAAALAAEAGTGSGRWRAAADDTPLLEELVRAFCRGEDRLDGVERLMSRLDPAKAGGSDPVPPEFRKLWESFRIALETRERRHGA